MFPNIYSLPPLISSIFFFALGAYMIYGRPKMRLKFFFGLVCLATFWWQFSWFFLFNADDPKMAVLLAKIGYAGIILIPVFFFHFFAVFLRCEKKIDKILLIVSYALAGLFEVALFASNRFISGVYEFFWGFYPKAGELHLVYLFLLSLLTARIICLLSRRMRESEKNSINYLRHKYLFLGFIFYVFSASDFLVNYGVGFYPFGFVFIIFFLAITGYAINRYRLLAEEVAIAKFLINAMGLILLTLPFLMPSAVLRVITAFIFFLFCFFGYYSIKSAENESRRREIAEINAEKLRRLDTAKNQFLLSTQHHLRGPLSVVQGYLSMLKDGDYGNFSELARKKIEASIEATQKMVKLVDDLLDMARFQMDKGTAAKQNVDVAGLIDEVVRELEKTAAAKNIFLRFEKITPTLPLISADGRGIKEAIYNIVDNAVKYTQAGGVAVSARVEDAFLRISIVDTGIGMNQKDLQGLFERTFERGEKAKNININGKGIGLYLAAQMVKSNGGRIFAKSAGWGRGSEFIIEFPVSDQNDSVGGLKK